MEKIVHSSLEIEHDDSTWVAEWVSYIIRDGSETKDRFLVVSKKNPDGTLISVKDLFNPYGPEAENDEKIRRVLTIARLEEIQSEYGIPTNLSDSVEVAEKVLTRVWAGEWMGQQRDSYSFYIDNLASILNQDFMQAAMVVKVLGQKRITGLNGFIIVPWAEEEAAFKSWEEATGHKRLFVSDGGGWGCAHCGQSRDEREEPAREVPCTPQILEREE